jgi:chromatin remodeling complex protein RSC6
MKKIVKLTESDLTKLVKRVMNEDLSDREGDLYSSINKLIDREFDDVESSVIVDVLGNILDNHKARSHRKKHNIKDISSDDVRKNWNRKR